MSEAALPATSSSTLGTAATNGEAAPATASAALSRGQKRTRDSSATPAAAAPPPSAHAPQSSAPRRIESVIFGGYEITTSYSSPYPFEDAIAGGGAGGGAGGAGQKGALTRENTGRFGSQPVADGNTTRTTSANGRRKSALGPTKSITPELVAPPPVVPAPTVKQEVETAAEAGPSRERVDMDVDIIEDSEAGSPQTVAGQETVGSFGTDGEDALVASALLPHIHRTASPALATAPPPPAPADPSAEPPSELPPSASTIPAVEPPSNSSALPSDPHAPLARGHGGRFKPKPPGETVRGKRQMAKAAKAAAAALAPAPPAPGVDLPPPAKHLTVREQREIKKRAREEREREAAANGEGQGHMTTKRLFVCEGCFKYMLEPTALTKHVKECQYKRPPGKKVYQRGAHTIYEVDGAVEKLYCQNLCLFGKLFIEHKYMFFDVEGFVFYIMCDATPSRDWPLAYFSKEKVSYDDYNLACIVTFPQYRQRGWATLLIEFSYEITRRTASTPGTPERPLSALGMRGYLAYWTGVLVRYFRAVFEHFGAPPPVPSIAASPAAAVAASPEHDRKKGRRSRSGWDGELPGAGHGTGLTVSLKRDAGGQASAALVPSSSRSSSRKRFNGAEADFVFPTTLTDIAEATNIKPDDVAFALVESGLAQWRRPVISDEGEEEEAGEKVLELIISKELVEQVAKEKGVRDSPMLDLAYVLL